MFWHSARKYKHQNLIVLMFWLPLIKEVQRLHLDFTFCCLPRKYKHYNETDICSKDTLPQVLRHSKRRLRTCSSDKPSTITKLSETPCRNIHMYKCTSYWHYVSNLTQSGYGKYWHFCPLWFCFLLKTCKKRKHDYNITEAKFNLSLPLLTVGRWPDITTGFGYYRLSIVSSDRGLPSF